jgi:rhamnosyltransferase subunit B
MAFVIVTAWGIRGDVMPYLGIGAALRQRGHDVTLVANPVYEREAKAAGLSFVPVGRDEEYQAFINEPGLWNSDVDVHGRAGIKYFLPSVEQIYRAVVALYRPRETILLASRHGAWIAREQLNIPTIGFRLSPSVLSRYDPMHPLRGFPAWTNPIVRSQRGLRLLYTLKGVRDQIRARYNGPPHLSGWIREFLAEIQRVRRLAGLGESPATPDAAAPALTICFWPSWLSAPQKDWPPNTKVTGFAFYPKPGARVRRSDWADPSRPIVFMRGSAASHQAEFFAEAVKCCLALRRPGVLLTPHANDAPSDLPPGIRHVGFAPLGELFGNAAAVVHHGGVATIGYAVAAGIPQVVAPILGDQFDLGYRMERLGVGSMVTDSPPTARRLARELRSLLQSRSVQRRCEKYGEMVDPDEGLSRAADLIEGVIAERLSGASR